MELSKAEKTRLIKIAVKHIIPIADKYEVTDKMMLSALSEAFHTGIKYALKSRELRERE
jgi:hypothetical protein